MQGFRGSGLFGIDVIGETHGHRASPGATQNARMHPTNQYVWSHWLTQHLSRHWLPHAVGLPVPDIYSRHFHPQKTGSTPDYRLPYPMTANPIRTEKAHLANPPLLSRPNARSHSSTGAFDPDDPALEHPSEASSRSPRIHRVPLPLL